MQEAQRTRFVICLSRFFKSELWFARCWSSQFAKI